MDRAHLHSQDFLIAKNCIEHRGLASGIMDSLIPLLLTDRRDRTSLQRRSRDGVHTTLNSYSILRVMFPVINNPWTI